MLSNLISKVSGRFHLDKVPTQPTSVPPPPDFTPNMVSKFPVFTDKLATRIYSELANKLRTLYRCSGDQKKYKYYMNHNTSLVPNIDPIVITVKFESTQKRLRFIFSEGNTTDYEVQFHQKTNNIVEDISNIHKLLNTSYVNREVCNTSPTMVSRELDDLLDWGFTNKEDYGNDVHKVPAVVVFPDTELDRKDCLYVDIIHEVSSQIDRTNFSTMTVITTMNDRTYVLVNSASRNYIKPGDVILVNYKDEFNILELPHTKKHVMYTASQMQEMTRRIELIQEEIAHNE